MDEIPEAWLQWRMRPRGVGSGPAPEITSQELYAQFIKHSISPGLRDNGLVGSGGRYTFRSESHWALVGFQKSWYSDRTEVRFTINLLSVPRKAWDELVAARPHLGSKPSALTLYGDRVEQRRIGDLLPARNDRWWQLSSGQDLEPLRTEVMASMLDYGLPWLRHQVADT